MGGGVQTNGARSTGACSGTWKMIFVCFTCRHFSLSPISLYMSLRVLNGSGTFGAEMAQMDEKIKTLSTEQDQTWFRLLLKDHTTPEQMHRKHLYRPVPSKINKVSSFTRTGDLTGKSNYLYVYITYTTNRDARHPEASYWKRLQG